MVEQHLRGDAWPQSNSVAENPRFERFKERHQTISIPKAIARLGLSGLALSWYVNCRLAADWSTGVLPPHATPAWLEENFGVSRRQRLSRERELRRFGLFESHQVMRLRVICGRERWVKTERTARIFSEPQTLQEETSQKVTSQKASENAGSFSVPFLSRLKNGTPNSLKNQSLRALKSSKVKSKSKSKSKSNSSSLPLDRLTPRSPELEPKSGESLSESQSLDLTGKNTNAKPSVQEKPKPEPKFRPDLTLTTVLAIVEKYFLTSDDVRSWMNVEERWRAAGGPVDWALLVKFLDDAITSMGREGLIYHPVALLRLKQLRRHEFSPRLSAPSTSLRFTPPPGSCSRCGGEGIAVKNGVGSYCDCIAGKRLMFPNRKAGDA
jgi:hypothetical protein